MDYFEKSQFFVAQNFSITIGHYNANLPLTLTFNLIKNFRTPSSLIIHRYIAF